MKNLLLSALLLCAPISALADSCDGSKLARDAIRAVALVSNRAMITDLVGGGEYIWANYRNHGYSDHYFVKVDSSECRLLELKLIAANEPIKEPN